MTRSTSASDGINQPTHLVILCCHAVYYGTLGSDPRDENNWALKPFQRSTATKSGEHETFLQHAFAAVQLSNADTLIAFSGGPTDSNYPDLSEARSYLNAFGDWCAAIGLEVPKVARAGGSGEGILLEERATDSYQNVLFSILAFRRRTGYYPEQLTIITHAFKNDRFLHLHSRALKWPAERVKVLGINPPFTLAELEGTIAGEKRNGYAPWETDLYGVRDPLAGKRKVRGWDDGKSKEPGKGLEPAVHKLLLYDGGAAGNEVFPETLPWE